MINVVVERMDRDLRVGPGGVINKDDIESSDHLKLLGSSDEQEARALELDSLGYVERATWIRNCGNPNSPYPKTKCGLRGWCPACSRRIARNNGQRAAAAMGRMTYRLVALFVLPVPLEAGDKHRCGRGKKLKDAVRSFRVALRELRRRPCLRPALGGVEVFEFDLSEHGCSWNVHCHAVFDLAAIDAAAVEATWKDLTRGRGWFSLPPEEAAKVVSTEHIERFAYYMTSAASWAPAPGSLTVDQLETLQIAIKGKQLVTSWGTAAKPRRAVGGKGTAARRARRVPFFFHADQLELVEAAIRRASELSNSASRAANLALICMDFLATNEFGLPATQQRSSIIYKYEQITGLRFIVWDPSQDALVHGHRTLTKLARRV